MKEGRHGASSGPTGKLRHTVLSHKRQARYRMRQWEGGIRTVVVLSRKELPCGRFWEEGTLCVVDKAGATHFDKLGRCDVSLGKGTRVPWLQGRHRLSWRQEGKERSEAHWNKEGAFNGTHLYNRKEHFCSTIRAGAG